MVLITEFRILRMGREALEKMMGSTFIDKMDKEAALLLGLEDK